ncbi:MAG: DNA-directed RNA polymerase sigma-70 factor [Pirellulaceae bacterium]|nr:MAG: DNA-directed RNA polymerase sigma-70 factor [Pirellulaceae bacterium]
MKPTAVSGASELDVRKLVTLHQVGLWRYLRALGCPADMAEDLVQETFLLVLQRPFQDYDDRATRAYLRRVARNLLVSHLRRTGRTTQLEQIEELESEWDRWAGQDDGQHLLDALRDCFQQLSQRVRSALEMRFREKCSRRQIAAALQMTEHGAKNLLQRAKQKLRRCIEEKLS